MVINRTFRQVSRWTFLGWLFICFDVAPWWAEIFWGSLHKEGAPHTRPSLGPNATRWIVVFFFLWVLLQKWIKITLGKTFFYYPKQLISTFAGLGKLRWFAIVVRIAPHDYNKQNMLVTLTLQQRIAQQDTHGKLNQVITFFFNATRVIA